MNLDYHISLCPKINTECIEDLNLRHNAFKPLEENIWQSFSTLEQAEMFLDKTSKVQKTTAKNENWDISKLKM